MLQIWKMYTKM